MTDALFDLPAPSPTPDLSPGQRLTIRNTERFAQGIHPVGRCTLANNGETCGTCRHHIVRRYARPYHKCDLNETGGAGTDIRLSWPACALWEGS